MDGDCARRKESGMTPKFSSCHSEGLVFDLLKCDMRFALQK